MRRQSLTTSTAGDTAGRLHRGLRAAAEVQREADDSSGLPGEFKSTKKEALDEEREGRRLLHQQQMHMELWTGKGVIMIQVLHVCFVQSRAILNLHIWDGRSALPNLELDPKPSLVFVS